MGLVGEAQVQAVVKKMAAKVKQVNIDKFTALCKNLQRRQEVEDHGGEEGAYDDPLVRPVTTHSCDVHVNTYRGSGLKHSRTTDNEEWGTSLQWTYCLPHY